MMLRFFHRVDDPWSFLLAQLLPGLLDAYDIGLECITVPFPTLDFAPRPDLLTAHALRDALDLARHCDLAFDGDGTPPDPALAALAAARLLDVHAPAAYLALAVRLGTALFRHDAASIRALCHGVVPDPARLLANQARQLREGHFNTGMIGFGENWYWGVDRLAHLENDLLTAGRRRPGHSVGLLQRKPARLDVPIASATLELEYFCTFRSPYTYIGTARTFDLARRYPIRLVPRLMLPMKMAGYVVPPMKSAYFRFDPAREALRHGVRFGNFCDPFGAGLERAMALVDHARAVGRLEAYILSVMQGVWADGLDTATDAGLRLIAERAGLDWPKAEPHLADQGWRNWAAENRAVLETIGQYAAPTYRLADYVTWGQDRIWMLERQIRARLGLDAG